MTDRSFSLFLRNEDVTTTTYASSYPERRDPFSVWPATGAKIGDVCAKLLSELEKDPRRNILPILSCLVRSGGRGGVEAALKRIDASRRREAGGEAADALDFLLLLVDVDALFDVALGLYDFDLVGEAGRRLWALRELSFRPAGLYIYVKWSDT